jgi:hypothetical protein
MALSCNDLAVYHHHFQRLRLALWVFLWKRLGSVYGVTM